MKFNKYIKATVILGLGTLALSACNNNSDNSANSSQIKTTKEAIKPIIVDYGPTGTIVCNINGEEYESGDIAKDESKENNEDDGTSKQEFALYPTVINVGHITSSASPADTFILYKGKVAMIKGTKFNEVKKIKKLASDKANFEKLADQQKEKYNLSYRVTKDNDGNGYKKYQIHADNLPVNIGDNTYNDGNPDDRTPIIKITPNNNGNKKIQTALNDFFSSYPVNKTVDIPLTANEVNIKITGKKKNIRISKIKVKMTLVSSIATYKEVINSQANVEKNSEG